MSGSFLRQVYGPPHDRLRPFLLRAGSVWFVAPLVISRGLSLFEACRTLGRAVVRRPLGPIAAILCVAIQQALIFPVIHAASDVLLFAESSRTVVLLIGTLALAVSALLISLHVYFIARMSFALARPERSGWQSVQSG